MPINLQDFSQQLGEYIRHSKDQLEELNHRHDKARQIFDSLDGQNEELQTRLSAALQKDPDLRSAIPLDEPLSTSKAPATRAMPKTIIGADGSQIYTDRHSGLSYAMVNTAAVVIKPAEGQAPQSINQTSLHAQNFLMGSSLSRDQVDLMRDLEERQILAKLAKENGGSTVTLTDGLLELWHGIGQKEGEAHFKTVLARYLSALSELRDAGATTAGYIDKPQANYITRLIEIAGYHDKEIDIRKKPPLAGVSDRWLLAKLLEPGQRSAVFGIQSRSSKDYTGDFGLHFFYINVGVETAPCISRVDIPKWVADNPEMLDMLHNALIEQTKIFKTTPFPYCLQRAHEEALIRRTDQEEIETRMVKAMQDAGLDVDLISNKSFLKTLLY